MKRVTVNVDELMDHPDNPHTHPESQIDGLADSLVQFKQVKNIVVWRGYILAGHGLRAGARRAGIETLEAVDVSEWDESKAVSFMLADIRLPDISGIDEGQLAEVLQAIDDPLNIPGFDESYLAQVDETSRLLLELDSGLKGSASPERALGDRKKQIKPVLYVDEVAVFEKALKLTGQQNRGQALMEICEFYIDKKGQFDLQLESAVEEAGLEFPV